MIHNHSYYGASHEPDVAFVTPIFHGDDLIGFSTTTAHHLDLGALTPGSCGIVDASDAYAEGLQLTAIKIEEGGRRNEWIWRILRDNVRAASLVVGDMEAQIAAARTGAERFLELVDRYGIDTVQAASEDLMDYSERMLRAEIERLPDGTYSAEGFVDGFIDHPDPRYRDLRVAVAVTVSGSEIHVDLTGPRTRDRPAAEHALRGNGRHRDLPDPALDPPRQRHPPARAGQLGPVPAHLDPRARGVAGQPALPRAHDRALLHRQRAGGHAHARDRADRPGPRQRRGRQPQGRRLLRPAAGGRRTLGVHGHPGGLVRGPAREGRPRRGRHPLREHRATTPSRTSRATFPLRVTRYELREDSAGAGRWRGGIGTVREIEMLADGGFSLEGDGAEHPPPGLFGGEDGTPGAVVLNAGTDREQVLPSKFPYRKAATRGAAAASSPSSGGGYGDPAERDPAAVRDDVADGYVTPGGCPGLEPGRRVAI